VTPIIYAFIHRNVAIYALHAQSFGVKLSLSRYESSFKAIALLVAGSYPDYSVLLHWLVLQVIQLAKKPAAEIIAD
jgi:hypothetical protein